MELRYWSLRGRPEPIKMLLNYLKLDYTFKGYELTEYKQWHEVDKPQLNTFFPNLPYLRDGEEVITESDAIVQYICFKANRGDLVGNTNEERVRIAKFRGFVLENILQIGISAYDKDYQKNKEATYTRFAKQLGYMEDYLSKNKFGNGDKLCAYDFHLYDFVFIARKFFSEHDILVEYPHIGQHHKTILAIPEIQNYLQSEKYNSGFKIFGPTSAWNADSSL